MGRKAIDDPRWRSWHDWPEPWATYLEWNGQLFQVPVLPICKPSLKVRDIIKTTAEECGISLNKFLSSRRGREITRPRQIAMYLATELTKKSLPEIGRAFKRDHTTVMHGARQVKERLRDDVGDTRTLVDAIRRRLG